MEDGEMVREKAEEDPVFLLGGTSLRVYMLLLRAGKPLGVREVQRALKFKSVSTAKHHLDKLVELGLARRTERGYEALRPRGILSSYVSLAGSLVPRSLALAFFALASAVAYSLTPGSDPAAVVLLIIIGLLALYDGVDSYIKLRRALS
jgi:DNA-binding transcriptional ArsR family regulator